MRIVFFGSDDLAKVCLEAILRSQRHSVLACVTQPDRPKGREMQISTTAVKDFALKNNIEVLQPLDLTDQDFVTKLRLLSADLFVVIAYGRLLTPEVLSLPKIFAINLHASLLPKYRGAAPINWAIINGESETGLSVIKISPKLDEGDIIAQKPMVIDIDDDAVTLKGKMKDEGPRFLSDVLQDIEQGEFCLMKQNDLRVSQASKLSKEIGRIDWKKDAVSVHNLVRGLVPWPSAYTYFEDKALKILQTKVIAPEYSQGAPGEVLAVLKDGFVVRAGRGALLVKKVHLESSRLMDAKSFVAGHHLSVGFRFS